MEVKKRPGSAGSRPGSAAGSRPGSAAGSRPGSARPSSSQVIIYMAKCFDTGNFNVDTLKNHMVSNGILQHV